MRGVRIRIRRVTVLVIAAAAGGRGLLRVVGGPLIRLVPALVRLPVLLVASALIACAE
jgi:hypothetical protein